jgi:hypothetical protein
MIVWLVGMAVCWLVCEIAGEALMEGLAWVVRRLGWVPAFAWWLLTFGAIGGIVAWWHADPASDFRTQVACVSWALLPLGGLAAMVARDSARPAPGLLPRGTAGGGVLRSGRPRVR